MGPQGRMSDPDGGIPPTYPPSVLSPGTLQNQSRIQDWVFELTSNRLTPHQGQGG